MTYSRKASTGLLLCFIIPVLSCVQSRVDVPPAKFDSAWISVLKQNYDSLYDACNKDDDALLLERAGAYADSAIRYGKPLLTDTALRKQYMRFLFLRADDLNVLGDYNKSLDYYLIYFSLHDSLRMEQGKQYFYAAKNTANIYARYGDYTNAVRLLTNSLAYFTGTNDTKEILSSSINLSIALKEKELYDSAILVLHKALENGLADKRRTWAIYNELAANNLLLNNTVNASFFIRDALQISRTDSAQYTMPDIYSETLKLYGNLQMADAEYKEAITAYTTSLHVSGNQAYMERTRENGKIFNMLGAAHEALGNIDSALYYYRHALYTVANIDTANIFSLPSEQDLYAENTIMESLDNIGNCMSRYCNNINRLQWLSHVAACYMLAMQTERKLMLNFSYNDSKLLMLQSSRQRSEKAIDLCYQLYSLTKQDEWVGKAFQFAEKNKAFILLESVQRNLASSAKTNDTLYQRLQQMQIQYAMAETNLAVATLQKDTAALQQYSRLQKDADEDLQQAKINYRLYNQRYNEWEQNNDSVSLTSVQNFLPDDQTAVIEYFTGDSLSYCFLFIKNKKSAICKLSRSLQANITNLLYFFKDKNNIIKDPVAYNRVACTLFKTFRLDGVDKNINSLVIVPDNDLYFVPFDALVTDTSASYNLASYDYLVRKYDISYAYSATMLLAQSGRSNSNNKTIVFAPLFEQGQRKLSPLPFSKTESRNVLGYTDGDGYSGSSASLINFKQNAGSAGIIHIATHAASSGIPRIEFYDSTLYLNELYAMQLQANLAVLSGCETGIGKIEKSEGAMSLARGFYYAGVRNVITTLWNADDNATSEIFGNFYRSLSGNNYRKALHKAKLEYLKDGKNNDKYSPYYWAGIIYTGYEKPADHSIWYVCATVLLIALLFALWKKASYKQRLRIHRS